MEGGGKSGAEGAGCGVTQEGEFLRPASGFPLPGLPLLKVLVGRRGVPRHSCSWHEMKGSEERAWCWRAGGGLGNRLCVCPSAGCLLHCPSPPLAPPQPCRVCLREGAGGHRRVKKCQCLGCWGAPRPSSCVLRVRPNPPPVSPRLFFFLPQPIHLILPCHPNVRKIVVNRERFCLQWQ